MCVHEVLNEDPFQRGFVLTCRRVIHFAPPIFACQLLW
jgi:hypothetical protein